MILYRLPKEQKSSYVNNLMVNEKYMMAKYADRNLKIYPHTDEIKTKIIEENEHIINDYNENYRSTAGQKVVLGTIIGICSCFVTEMAISIPPTSLGAVFVQASIAFASITYGLKKTINAYLTLIDINNVDKAIYLMENKEIINSHIKEKCTYGLTIDRKSPYKYLVNIFERTGEIELNITNVNVMQLKQLRELKRLAELANDLKSSNIQLSQTESSIENGNGVKIKK